MNRFLTTLAESLVLIAATNAFTSCNNDLIDENGNKIISTWIALPTAEEKIACSLEKWTDGDELSMLEVRGNSVVKAFTMRYSARKDRFTGSLPKGTLFFEYNTAVYNAFVLPDGKHLQPAALYSGNMEDVLVMYTSRTNNGGFRMGPGCNILKIVNNRNEDVEVAFSTNYMERGFKLAVPAICCSNNRLFGGSISCTDWDDASMVLERNSTTYIFMGLPDGYLWGLGLEEDFLSNAKPSVIPYFTNDSYGSVITKILN